MGGGIKIAAAHTQTRKGLPISKNSAPVYNYGCGSSGSSGSGGSSGSTSNKGFILNLLDAFQNCCCILPYVENEKIEIEFGCKSICWECEDRLIQSCEMSGIWGIYLCKHFGDLG